MFSYRHAFHAGNHADVFKHTVLIATLQYLTDKDAALTVLDSHAGAGLYRLDGDYARTSGEAADGVVRLFAAPGSALAPALQAYVDMVGAFNQGHRLRVYPGSPCITQRLLRESDKLKLFEWHPTDLRALAGHVAQLQAGRQVAVFHEDGFQGIRKFLPPPQRRALLLCDPSYEIKSDYGKVLDLATDSLKRFATGCYMFWYPIIGRPEAHELPRRLKTLASKAGKSWLHATLTVKSGQRTAAGSLKRPGLPASGMFLINPPFTLKAALTPALPQMVQLLGDEDHAQLAHQMGLGFRDFAGDEGIGAGRNGRLEVTLRAPGAPGHATDGALRRCVGLHQRHRAPQGLRHMVCQGLAAGKGGACHKAQVLLAKARIRCQAEHPAELGVVAPLSMGVQRQVVGKQVDVMRQQQLQPLLEPAGHAAVLSAPEQAVVHEDGIGLRGDGRFDQRAAGAHAADDACNLGPAFDLQAVGAVVLEALGLQQAVKGLQKSGAGDRHAAIVALVAGDRRARIGRQCGPEIGGRRLLPWPTIGADIS